VNLQHCSVGTFGEVVDQIVGASGGRVLGVGVWVTIKVRRVRGIRYNVPAAYGSYDASTYIVARARSITSCVDNIVAGS
jgi:hypothetical protein